MKIQMHLIQAIGAGLAALVVTTACHRDDAKSGHLNKQEKEKKERVVKKSPDNCPACGMG